MSLVHEQMDDLARLQAMCVQSVPYEELLATTWCVRRHSEHSRRLLKRSASSSSPKEEQGTELKGFLDEKDVHAPPLKRLW